MESENGVAIMEDEKHVIGETTEENINKEKVEDICNSEIQTNNEVSQSTVEIEGHNSAVSKNSKLSKEPSVKGGAASNSIASKNTKSGTKDKPNLKATTSSSKTQRQNLSKSLSFSTKPTRGDVMKKSTDGIRVSSRLTNSEVNSKKETKTNQGNSKQRTSLPSMNSFKRSEFGRSTTVNAVAKSLTSEASISVDQVLNPAKTDKLNKEDDDSTTSSLTPRRRSSGFGFSSRLEERAEKRKEFFSKLEEKIQEKEAEKTNLQEKSKENQEAEIKQMRKKMTFKAAPMPSFYKEPPPKVELKKIPTTRPKSPKLGRNKGSAVSNNLEDKSCSIPHGKEQQNVSNKAKAKGHKDVGSKKPIRKTQAKLQSQEIAITKNDTNKVSGISQDAKAGIGGNEECQDPIVNISEYQSGMELESQNDIAQNGALVINTSTPEIEIVSYEVAVGV